MNQLIKDDVLFSIIDSTASHIREGYELDTFLGNGRFNLDDEVEQFKSFISERKDYLRNNIGSLTQDYFEE